MAEEQFEHRLQLRDQIGKGFLQRYQHAQIQTYSDFYADALRLMKSSDLKAFDVRHEPNAVLQRYGNDSFAQGCLLARRLVQNGVRFVDVTHRGTNTDWDTHQNNFAAMPNLCGTFERGLATLLDDLEAHGMLEETLVVVATDFGRSPKIDVRNGRQHHPGAFSGVLAGGGVRGGQIYGQTDEIGFAPIENTVSISDFNATIVHALGLDPHEENYSAGPPFSVADKGNPVTAIF